MAPIKMAVGDRLETQHLLSGRVKIEGFDVEFTNPGPAPAPTFNDTVTKLSYDVAELTSANFVIAKDAGVPLIGLPVVPNVFYPLTGVTVSKASGIKSPKDFTGKRVAVATGYASNPGVWLRGILAHQFDVSAESITWVEGEADSLRGIDYPRSARFKTEKTTDLHDRLAAGEIDALIAAGGRAGESKEIAEIFMADPTKELGEYYSTTNVLPINTMFVMKEEAHANNPGLADAVVAASKEANAIYHAEESDAGVHQGLNVGTLRKLGIFPRSHGLDLYGDTMRMLVQYLYEQGLIKRLWKLEELFV